MVRGVVACHEGANAARTSKAVGFGIDGYGGGGYCLVSHDNLLTGWFVARLWLEVRTPARAVFAIALSLSLF